MFIRGHVLVFGTAEMPNLIGLNSLTREVSQDLTLIRGAGCPERFQQSKIRHLDAPVMREVARREFPSTRNALVCLLNTFH